MPLTQRTKAGCTSGETDKTKASFKEPFRIDRFAPRSRGFYIAGALALLVYAVTPLSWLTVLICYLKKKSFPFSPSENAFAIVWYYYSLLEIVFSIYLQHLMWKWGRIQPPPKVDGQLLLDLLTRCLTVNGSKEQRGQDGKTETIEQPGPFVIPKRHIDKESAKVLRERLRIWFHYAPTDEIYADNIREWLSWAFTGRTLASVNADAGMAALIDEGLEMIKYRLDWNDIRPGYNENTRSIRLTLDPMRVLSRPLGYYIVCNAVSHGVISWLRLFHGFSYEYSGKCCFLVKLPARGALRRNSKKRGLPILFLHGLGIGIGQYVVFLRRLREYEDGVVIPYQPHISADITHRNYLHPPDKDEQAQATFDLLERLGMPKVTTLSHSNGTMVLGWLLRKKPGVCARNVLVDPVSFRLWEGSVCYSFIHRRWITSIEVLLGYFVARELGIARTIARNFQWSDMCLWVEDIPRLSKDDLHIIFGEVDLLVDVPSCASYLQEFGVSQDCITVVPDHQHGKALMFDGQGMQLVAKHLGLSQ